MEIKPSLYVSVTLIHIFFFYLLAKMENRFFFEAKTPLKIVTQNFVPIVEKKSIVKAPSKAVVATPQLISKAPPKAKAKNISPPKTDNKFKANSKSLLQKEPHHQNIIDALEQSIDRIGKESPRVKKAIAKATIKPISLSIDKEDLDLLDNSSSFYRDLLIAELKNRLNLPEMGEVKLKIVINEKGKVSEVAILHSKSKLNQNYLKEELMNMDFSNFMPKQKNTFNIIFKNEI